MPKKGTRIMETPEHVGKKKRFCESLFGFAIFLTKATR